MSRHARESSDGGGLTVEFDVSFGKAGRARRVMHEGEAPVMPPEAEPPKRRSAAEMLGLAHYFERLVREGRVCDYAELARRTSFTRARITQVMGLLLLPPAVQEDITVRDGVDSEGNVVGEHALRGLMRIQDWREARRQWCILANEASQLSV